MALKVIHYIHKPVMVNEVVEYLISDTSGIYVDCTIGGGGHAEAILQNLSEDGELIGIDQDFDAIEAARDRLKKYENRVKLIKGNFNRLNQILPPTDYSGFLFDLGVSSYQIDTASRGFSFQLDAPLDMRMDRTRTLNAQEIVNHWDFDELYRIFREYGEERWSKRIARAIIRKRKEATINTTNQLAEIVKKATPDYRKNKTLARIFQALRIAVNDELTILEQSIKDAVDLLQVGGRMVIISYHSLEDRIAKHTIKELEKGCTCPPKFPKCVCGKTPTLKRINKKVIRPSEEEKEQNPRSRSAKLRCAERI